jgi:hypothetical protein
VIPSFVTKEMIKEKKRQIVKAEKAALAKQLQESQSAGTTKEEAKAAKQEEEKEAAKPKISDIELEQRRKIAEAVKAVIKSGKEAKDQAESDKTKPKPAASPPKKSTPSLLSL